jgi:hypothetical protein
MTRNTDFIYLFLLLHKKVQSYLSPPSTFTVLFNNNGGLAMVICSQ